MPRSAARAARGASLRIGDCGMFVPRCEICGMIFMFGEYIGCFLP